MVKIRILAGNSWLQVDCCTIRAKLGTDGVDMLDTAKGPATATQDADELQLAQLIVSALNLDIVAADIDPEAPLFGDGLGLDSIDILEISLAISQNYKIKLRADDANNLEIFSTLRSLNRHIQQQRTG